MSRRIAVLSTAGADGWPEACTVFYVLRPDGALAFKSRSASRHMQNVLRDPRAAMAVYDHGSTYVRKAGIQLSGTIEAIRDEADMASTVDEYSARFDGARDKFTSIAELIAPDAASTMFRFVPQSAKLLDGSVDRADTEYIGA